MKEKQYILVRANKYDIEEPEIFVTFYNAYETMKMQYEICSKGCIGELNYDNAWCMDDDDCITNWKIFGI